MVTIYDPLVHWGDIAEPFLGSVLGSHLCFLCHLFFFIFSFSSLNLHINKSQKPILHVHFSTYKLILSTYLSLQYVPLLCLCISSDNYSSRYPTHLCINVAKMFPILHQCTNEIVTLMGKRSFA